MGACIALRPESPWAYSVRGLAQARRGRFDEAIDDLNRGLDKVTCPVAVLQGTEDRVVDPKSAEIIFQKIGSQEKQLDWIEAERHGILRNDIGGTVRIVSSFIESLKSDTPQQEQRRWRRAAAAEDSSRPVVYQGEA